MNELAEKLDGQGMNPATLTFIFLGIAMLLLVRNILRPDIVTLLLLLSLGLTGILTPRRHSRVSAVLRL